MKVIGFGVIGLLVGGPVASGILLLIFLTGGAEYTVALAWALVYGIIPGAVVGFIVGLIVGGVVRVMNANKAENESSNNENPLT